MGSRLVLGLVCLVVSTADLHADANVRVEVNEAGGITLFRPTLEQPLLVFNAPEDARPFIHPLLAPDGNGLLTEYAPGHHKHQTGIYVGFLKVNGRDYFHNRGADHFRRVGFKHEMNSQGVFWSTTYELLGAKKEAQLTETQSWHFRDFTKSYLMDLTWTAKAHTDITFDKYDYGGLFIRMPFKGQPGSKVINSEGHANEKAEGQKARWVDIGMTVDGRKDAGHIAVMSHVEVPWRVDGQFGVGPAPSRAGAWKLAKGETVTLRYRLMVYTGEFNEKQVEAESKAFIAIK
jgi:hypothetical protein